MKRQGAFLLWCVGCALAIHNAYGQTDAPTTTATPSTFPSTTVPAMSESPSNSPTTTLPPTTASESPSAPPTTAAPSEGPAQTMVIVSAFYGRTKTGSEGVCVHPGLDEVTGCVQDATQWARNNFEGREEGVLSGSWVLNWMFGDPCFGTVKYLSVTWKCGEETRTYNRCEYDDTDRVIGCGPGAEYTVETEVTPGDQTTAAPPSGEAMQIVSSFYGRKKTGSEGVCVHAGLDEVTGCLTDTTEWAKVRFEGKVSAQVYGVDRWSLNGMFGDPCYGTVKYLSVTWKCGEEIRTFNRCEYEGSAHTIGCGDDATYEIGDGTESTTTAPSTSGDTIQIVSAFYGRKKTGSEGVCAFPGLDEVTGCEVDTTQWAKQQFNGRQDGLLRSGWVLNWMFGDPCFGTVKYLSVTWKCGDEIRNFNRCESDTDHKIGCGPDAEYTVVTDAELAGLPAPDTTDDSNAPAMEIVSAFYGRTKKGSEGVCAWPGLDEVTGCHQDATQWAKDNFDGKTKGQLSRRWVLNGMFGDPCFGTVKYLSVTWKCGEEIRTYARCENDYVDRTIGCTGDAKHTVVTGSEVGTDPITSTVFSFDKAEEILAAENDPSATDASLLDALVFRQPTALDLADGNSVSLAPIVQPEQLKDLTLSFVLCVGESGLQAADGDATLLSGGSFQMVKALPDGIPPPAGSTLLEGGNYHRSLSLSVGADGAAKLAIEEQIASGQTATVAEVPAAGGSTTFSTAANTCWKYGVVLSSNSDNTGQQLCLILQDVGAWDGSVLTPYDSDNVKEPVSECVSAPGDVTWLYNHKREAENGGAALSWLVLGSGVNVTTSTVRRLTTTSAKLDGKLSDTRVYKKTVQDSLFTYTPAAANTGNNNNGGNTDAPTGEPTTGNKPEPTAKPTTSAPTTTIKPNKPSNVDPTEEPTAAAPTGNDGETTKAPTDNGKPTDKPTDNINNDDTTGEDDSSVKKPVSAAAAVSLAVGVCALGVALF